MIKRGSKIKVVKMDTAGGMDWQATRLEGKSSVLLSFIHDANNEDDGDVFWGFVCI